VLADLWNPHCLAWLSTQLVQEQNSVGSDDIDNDLSDPGLSDLLELSDSDDDLSEIELPELSDSDDDTSEIDLDNVSAICPSTGSVTDVEDLSEGYLYDVDDDLTSDNESISIYSPSDVSSLDGFDSDTSTDSVVLLWVHRPY